MDICTFIRVMSKLSMSIKLGSMLNLGGDKSVKAALLIKGGPQWALLSWSVHAICSREKNLPLSNLILLNELF